MSTIYLSTDLDFSSPYTSGSFGYADIPASEYVPPDGTNYLQAVLNVPAAVASPGGRYEFDHSELLGAYEPTGYIFGQVTPTTAGSGPAFGVYTYHCQFQMLFVAPPGLSGLGKAYVSITTTALSGVEYVLGGGAGYAALDAERETPRGEFNVIFHTLEEGTITVTVHFIGGSAPVPPTEAFWTDFVLAREIP